MASESITRPTNVNPKDFLNKIKDEQKRKDSFEVMKMMQKATGEKPVMWGSAIVGFGSAKLKYASGKELDWPVTGFSPRKQALTLYVVNHSSKEQTALLKKLGKHKTAKVCLYINKLSDVDTKVLEKVIAECLKK